MKTNTDSNQGKNVKDVQENSNVSRKNLLSTDDAFKQDAELVEHLSDYLANDSLFKFRDQLQQAGQAHRKHSNERKIIPLRTYWKQIASVAAIALVFVGIAFYLHSMKTTNELFNEYYEVDEVYMNTRSGHAASADVLEQGLLLFENDQYKESIEYFEKLPTSITAMYYSGVAHMEIGEYEVAVFKFDQVIDDYVNVFYDQAMWYKGLCLMKEEKNENAREIFNSIARSESFYNKQAKEIASKLR